MTFLLFDGKQVMISTPGRNGIFHLLFDTQNVEAGVLCKYANLIAFVDFRPSPGMSVLARFLRCLFLVITGQTGKCKRAYA